MDEKTLWIKFDSRHWEPDDLNSLIEEINNVVDCNICYISNEIHLMDDRDVQRTLEELIKMYDAGFVTEDEAQRRLENIEMDEVEQ